MSSSPSLFVGLNAASVLLIATYIMCCIRATESYTSPNYLSFLPRKELSSVRRSCFYSSTATSLYISPKERTRIYQRFGEEEKDLQPLNINGRSMKGYYVRPSRAIEKGGGFFVPGLEGDRIRIISALFLLILCAINAYGAQVTGSLTISVLTGVFATLVLFFQGTATSIGALLSNLNQQSEDTIPDDSEGGLVSLLPSSPSSVSEEIAPVIREILAAIATTCSSVLLIAVFPLLDATTTTTTTSTSTTTSTLTSNTGDISSGSPLIAFGPAEWKGNLTDILKASVRSSSSTTEQLNRAQIIDCTRLPTSGLPARTESLLLSPQGEKLLWVVAFACPPQQLRGKGGVEEWIAALLRAPIATP